MSSRYVDPDNEVEKKRQEFNKALLSDERIWEKYKEYREHDVKELINSYSLAKARLHVQGNYTQYHHQRLLDEWNDRAWNGLAEIQHKKLFDLQCRWRAGETQVPGLETSFHFSALQIPILDLEVIPPVTEEELKEYRKFLLTPNGRAHLYFKFYDHQNHEMIKEAHTDENGYMPEYYDYHYTIKGNTGLLQLPDHVGMEEDRLIKLTMDFLKKKNEKKPPAKKKAPEAKKYLSYHQKDIKIELAQFLGEKDVAAFIKDLEDWVKEKPSFETDWAMDYLSMCYPEPVPMPAAPTWQEAIEKAALDHISLKVHELLPAIYEEYLLKKSLGSPIGLLKSELGKEDKPLPMIWMEMGQKIERGEDVNMEEALKSRKWKDD